MGGPPPPPYCGPRAKATSWRVQAGGSSAVRAFALAARAAPPNLAFMGENAPPALFRFRNDLRKAPGRSSRDVSVSAPASSTSIARSDLGFIAGRRPPSFAARRFSAPPHWASAGIWPDPRGIASGISLECGAYFALPGVTAAAHTVPPRAYYAQFGKLPSADRAALGVAPVPASEYAEPGRMDCVGAGYCGVAGHPADYRVQYGGICVMRRRYRDPPYGRSSPRRSRSPGRLAKCLASPQRDGPSPDFKTAMVWPRRARPSRLWGCPAACVRSRPFAVRSTWLRPSDLRPSACLGQPASGSPLVPEGAFLLLARLGLHIFDFLPLVLTQIIKIEDPYAFRSRTSADQFARHRWKFLARFLDKASHGPNTWVVFDFSPPFL